MLYIPRGRQDYTDFSQFPEETEKGQSAQRERLGFLLFIRESGNNYPVNPVNPV
jgi:hypothetical protein